MSARSTTQSATDRGVDFWKIVAWAGLLLGGALYMVDPLELLSSPVVPICFVAAEPDSPAPVAIEIRDDIPKCSAPAPLPSPWLPAAGPFPPRTGRPFLGAAMALDRVGMGLFEPTSAESPVVEHKTHGESPDGHLEQPEKSQSDGNDEPHQ